MIIDLADPATIAVGSAALFCVALLLGLPAIRRVRPSRCELAGVDTARTPSPMREVMTNRNVERGAISACLST